MTKQRSQTSVRMRHAKLLASLLTGAWRDSPPSIDLSAEELAEVVPLLVGSGAAALAWWRIRNSDLRASPAALPLQQAYRSQVLEAALHQHEIREVFALLRAVGIEPVLVKGWSIGRLYPKGLRPSGDIDLYVRPKERELAAAVLKHRHSNSYAVDIEHDELARLDNRSIDELYGRSQLVSLAEMNIRVLGLEDHLGFLCIHMLRHGGWRPLWLCDVAVAVETRPPDFDWDYLLSKNRRQAAWISSAIGLAHQLLGAQVDHIPLMRGGIDLPGWLLPGVLKQWETPYAMNQAPMRYNAPIATYLRHPSGLLKELRARWPNPIEATVNVNGPFNETPRLFFQLADCILRAANFLGRLPESLNIRKSSHNSLP